MAISTFSTERLFGELLSLKHAAFIQKLLNTQGWLQFIGDRNVHSIPDAEAYIELVNSNTAFPYWVVRLKEPGVSVGIITFLQRDYLPHPDIGFAFLPEYCGKGYAFEAASRVIEEVDTQKICDELLAITLPANIASIRLLEKLGFTFKEEIIREDEKLSMFTLSRT